MGWLYQSSLLIVFFTTPGLLRKFIWFPHLIITSLLVDSSQKWREAGQSSVKMRLIYLKSGPLMTDLTEAKISLRNLSREFTIDELYDLARVEVIVNHVSTGHISLMWIQLYLMFIVDVR